MGCQPAAAKHLVLRSRRGPKPTAMPTSKPSVVIVQFLRQHSSATVHVCGKQRDLKGAQFRLMRDFVKRACFYSSDPERYR
ncbi:MAG: hypothetical protein OXT09_02765 [Myxococcales bacterium]|nr:hypothetical protein [Myxococcales bacterium]